MSCVFILAPPKSSRCDSVEVKQIKALSVEAMLLVMLQGAMSYALNGLLEFVLEHVSTIVISAIVTLAMVFLAKLFGADSNLNDDLDDSTDKERPPRPKWEVLSVLNWVVLTVFVVSITFTVVNYRKYFSRAEISGNSSHNILPMLCIWCVCMAYFYGFFGISFLDKSVMSPQDEYGMPGYVPPRGTDMEPAGVRKMSHHHMASPVKPTQHQMLQRRPQASPMTQHHQRPISDGPICAERTVRASKASAFTAPVCRTPATAASSAPPSSSALSLQNKGTLDFTTMTDEEVLTALGAGTIKDHELEKRLKDCARAVRIRRAVLEGRLNKCIQGLPCEIYDYNKILGANCEIVIGYVPVPVGVVGPLLLDGKLVYVPMATTEGCLVASTNRGCKAITEAGGAHAVLLKDGMTRAPLIRMPTATQAAEVKRFVEGAEGFHQVKEAFESTTSFGKLKTITSTVAGRNVFLRFVCHTGDPMGMNMISKGCLRVMELLEAHFPDMELLSISGNMCTDKKPAAVNWIEGRGKSVVAEAFIPDSIVRKVLKTTVQAVVDVNKQKNLVGSAMAGSVGGFNAHAANVVAAVFLATGQDIAQVVESANCITLLEEVNGGEMLHVSVTMPSIEVGTVGGGTHLEAQGACLDIVGVRGASKAPKVPGENAQQLAKVIATAVMAGELSLLAALAANHLVKAHMDHNRKPSNVSTHKPPTTPPPSPACAQLPGPLQSGDEAVRTGGGGSCIASE